MSPFQSPQGHVSLRFGGSEFILPQLPSISATQVVLQCDAQLSVPFRDWLAAWIKGKALPSDCAISKYKFTNEEAERIELKKAVVSAVSFPSLEAVSTDPGLLMVTLQAASITSKQGAGKAEAILFRPPILWRRRDFHLTVDGLPADKVSRIEGIAVASPGAFPNLKLLVASIEGPGFTSMKQSGKTAPAKLRFLFPDMKKVFLTLEFTTQVVSVVTSAGSPPPPGGRGPAPNSIAKISAELGMKNVSLTTA